MTTVNSTNISVSLLPHSIYPPTHAIHRTCAQSAASYVISYNYIPYCYYLPILYNFMDEGYVQIKHG